MKYKILPTFTLLFLLTSCSSPSISPSSDLLSGINSGAPIEILLGEKVDVSSEPFRWVVLDQLNTYPDFRQAFDKEVGIKLVKERTQERKHGVLYVDEDGNNDGNATLKDALQNQVFVEKYLENSEKKESLSKLSSMIYDITDDEERSFLYSLNAYYNLFDMGSSDSLISASRFDEPVTREEFYSAVFRAESKVSQSLKNNPGFDVDLGGSTEHSKYTKRIAPYGFLQVENKSLDELTYHGVITRAEALYTLVQLHFAKEYESADGELKAYEDTKNAGDLASILTIKDKDRWQAYSLSYMVENPKKGMQEELYKAMIVAKNNDILSDDESRWSEALTKGDALSFIVNTYLSKNREGYVSTVEYGVIVEEKAFVLEPLEEDVETRAIDPDSKPRGGYSTYREIREKIDGFYRSLINNGYSHDDAITELEVMANISMTTMEDLNNLQGYLAIGEERVVATAPSAPKPSTSNTPKPSTSTPSTPKPSQPKETISEYGYPITENDTNGNGILDFLEDNYANTDGTVSSPEGTPNPFFAVGEEPKETLSEYGYPITELDKDGNGIMDSIEDSYMPADGTVSSPEGTPNPFEMP